MPREKLETDLRNAIDFKHSQYAKDSFYNGIDATGGFMSKYMGRSMMFKMDIDSYDYQRPDNRKHRIDQMIATKKFMVGMQMHKVPQLRFPFATRRVVGRVKPGEVERQARQTASRKKTRGDVELLCKYMLFKNNKFMPGKMV